MTGIATMRRGRGDPYQGWITYAPEQNPEFAGQWHIRCKCGWTAQAIFRGQAGDMARAHAAGHGVVVPAPSSDRPGQAVPARQERPYTLWTAAAYAASIGQGRRI